LTDQVSSIFLKDWIGRIRPCATLSGVHLLVACGAGKSMPSSHAANCFGQAALFGLLYVQARWPLVIFASLVALSRVFVGVHYPGDVLVGTMVGLMIGLIVAWVFRRLPVSGPKNTP
jgi:undecaprenyl-diphosphatase